MTNNKKNSLQTRLDDMKKSTDTENDTNIVKSLEEKITKSKEDEMIEYGIKKVPVDYFHFEQYRYTRLEDALNQARKGKLRFA